MAWDSLKENIFDAIKEDSFSKDDITKVKKASQTWCCGPNLWGRESLENKVNAVFEERSGALTCLLGGKNRKD